MTAGSVTGMQDPAGRVTVVTCPGRRLGQDAAGIVKVVPGRVSVDVSTGRVRVEVSTGRVRVDVSPGSVVGTQDAPGKVSVDVSIGKVSVEV